MRMTIRQFSQLIEGDVVAERHYADENPADLVGVLRLVLSKCSDFLIQEGIPLGQDNIALKKMEFTYPGVAGRLQVLFEDLGGD